MQQKTLQYLFLSRKIKKKRCWLHADVENLRKMLGQKISIIDCTDNRHFTTYQTHMNLEKNI